MNAEKEGVYVGYYGNCSFVIAVRDVEGFSLRLHCDHSSVSPHIKVKDQKAKLNQLADLVVSRLNKGGEH